MLPDRTVKIDSFTGEYRWLSNFHPSPIRFEDAIYPTVENAYQAAKTLDPELRKRFQKGTPGQAKKWGRRLTIRDDWESVKVDIMRSLLLSKFSHPLLARNLLLTGRAYLEEGNYWGDTFWGVYQGEGENMLGKLLMDLRDLLRQPAPQGTTP